MEGRSSCTVITSCRSRSCESGWSARTYKIQLNAVEDVSFPASIYESSAICQEVQLAHSEKLTKVVICSTTSSSDMR
jgi:hypothetical protein